MAKPDFTPQEAVTELRKCVGGMKDIFAGYICMPHRGKRGIRYYRTRCIEYDRKEGYTGRSYRSIVAQIKKELG